MKGPFGLLLIGGGIILLVGLFTGKISLPGGAAASGPPPTITGTVPGSVNPNPPPSIIQIGKAGNCPTGYHLQRLGSVIVCVKNN